MNNLPFDLSTSQGLIDAARSAEARDKDKPWQKGIEEHLEWVESADLEERSSYEFQKRLWDKNPISSVGQGQISVEEALKSESLRRWIAEFSLQAMPDSRLERMEILQGFYQELVIRLKEVCSKAPRLKIFRVLASFFPLDISTVTNRADLNRLKLKVLGRGKLRDVERHVQIMEALDKALGAVDPSSRSAVVFRQRLPWLLSSLSKPEDVGGGDEVRDPNRLLPLPPHKRRKGLTAMGGGLATALGILEFINEGVTREELDGFLKAENPKKKAGSISAMVYSLRGELGTIRQIGTDVALTEIGATLLETEDPDSLRDWLLTKVLGVDHAIHVLRQGRTLASKDLQEEVRSMNPGWTSLFAPASMIGWLRSLDVIEKDGKGGCRLTERGEEWASEIWWTPEELATPDDAIEAIDLVPDLEVEVPKISEVEGRIQGSEGFPSSLIRDLHAALWAQERRHFAVFSGLSGSGKTLLARLYAKALTHGNDEARYEIIAVQPGWYDPTPIFGYAHPLRDGAYVRTQFLEILLRACEYPELPHVVILDEMNLSHPEQYLAPVLSGMETGEDLVLHAEGEFLDGVPARVRCPKNLALIGTVNMDETTQGLSDKVLDRAHVFEFWDIDVAAWPGWKTSTLGSEQRDVLRDLLVSLAAALAPARLHFGWRVVDEVVRFFEVRLGYGGVQEEVFDRVVYSKVLPKLRGTDTEAFRKALGDAASVAQGFSLPRCHEKIQSLEAELAATGTARFWS